MSEYIIHGGKRLQGEINISGGKNAILPILAAAVLNKNISVIKNCPRISDVFLTISILQAIGCIVNWEGNNIIIDSKNANNIEVPEKLVREMRSSITFLGALLGRFGSVKISHPGGCDLYKYLYTMYSSMTKR